MGNSFMLMRSWLAVFCGLLLMCLIHGCENTDTPKKLTPTLAKELVLYNWVDDMPQSVLDAFTKEYGVKVNYLTFESQEEAVENILQGKVYDVAVLENPFIPSLIAAKRLAEIDFHHVPNFKNISANFRDLAIDPGNRYTVPYHYGTTGLLVRTDLIGNAVTSWTDLWDPRFAGKMALRLQPRELISITLLSLGYGLNSENPDEVNAAVDRLIALKKLDPLGRGRHPQGGGQTPQRRSRSSPGLAPGLSGGPWGQSGRLLHPPQGGGRPVE